MAVTDVSICNLALTKLGADRITALDEDTTNGRACNAIYESIRDDVLTEHPWGFAQKRAALGLIDEDPEFTDDYVTLIYQIPTDCLKVNFTNVESALVKIEGDRILSDTASLEIKYTYRNETPQQYFSKFVMALATRLAAELAYPITSSRTLAADLLALYYEKALPSAMSADSQEGTPLGVIQDEWLNSRMSGSGGLYGRTGWETWWPC